MRQSPPAAKETIEILGKPGHYRIWINGSLYDYVAKTKGSAIAAARSYIKRHPEKFNAGR